MSLLQAGYESNAGLAFKLLAEAGPSAHRRLYYEPGVQWIDWKDFLHRWHK